MKPRRSDYFDSVCRLNNIPMFEVLQISKRVDGSKLKGWELGLTQRPRSYRYEWMIQIAMRVVRRYKIPAALIDVLAQSIQKKYGWNNHFTDRLPDPENCIGFLEPTTKYFGGLRTYRIGSSRTDPVIACVARYRSEKLQKLLAKKRHPEGDFLNAWIIQTELEKLLNERTKEQSRARRQQSRDAGRIGSSHIPAGQDHGGGNQQFC